jgi:hypothetical protein
MTMPGFTAEQSIRSESSRYRRRVQMIEENVVVPCVPGDQSCQWAADNSVHPTDLACKILRFCGGGPHTQPQLFGGRGVDLYGIDVTNCAIACNGNQNCIDAFC